MRLVLHPFLLAIYLVAFVLAGNMGEATLGDAWRVALVLLGVAGVACLLVRCIVARWEIVGFVVTVSLAVAFLHESIENLWVTLLPDFNVAILLAELIAVVGISYLAVRKISNWENVTRMLNISIGVLLLLSVFQMVQYEFSTTTRAPLASNGDSSFDLQVPDRKPDVYYILLDAYARDDALLEHYDHDNSEFTSYLKDKGFYIASDSTANYSATRSAVPAVMNFDYVGSGFGEDERGQVTTDTLLAATYDSKLARLFREIDYRIVNILAGIEYVRLGNAEVFELNEYDTALNEFELAMINMTPLPIITNKLYSFLPRQKRSATERAKQEYAMSQVVAQAGASDKPQFVFAHIFLPHPPFVFGRNGEERRINFSYFRNFSEAKLQRLRSAYVDQLIYVNKSIERVVEGILANSPEPPIIIIQADHGLRLSNSHDVDESCIKEVMGILTAIYYPDSNKRASLYPQISPVNTIRQTLNSYFGAQLPILPDLAYISQKNDMGFNFVDVTDRRNSCAGPWGE